MNKVRKIVVLSAILMIPLLSLAGCSKVSLTGTSTSTPGGGEQMGTPPDGGTPPDSGTPPSGGAPGAPSGD